MRRRVKVVDELPVCQREEARQQASLSNARAREIRRRAKAAVQQARELQSEAFSLRLEIIEARRSMGFDPS